MKYLGTLGPFVDLQGSKEAVADAIGRDPRISSLRISIGEERMPAMCLVCGFMEGADPQAFLDHDCETFQDAPLGDQVKNERAHWGEVARRLRVAGMEAAANAVVDTWGL